MRIDRTIQLGILNVTGESLSNTEKSAKMIAINLSMTAQGKAHTRRGAFASQALRPRYTKWHSKSDNLFR